MIAINRVEVYIKNVLVGTIALTNKGLCAFEYSSDFVKNGFSISPLELPLQSGVFIAKSNPFNGNFGVFDDCLPDGWGMIIMDRYLQKKGVNPYSLSILDKLSLVGNTGRGALEFRPDQSEISSDEFIDFNKMASEAQKILDLSSYTGEGIDAFYHHGGSPGGARPKIFVNFDNREWLVKFRAAFDPIDVGQTEYKYALLAKECGIDMPEVRLFDGKYYGVERFDRKESEKIHVVSVAGLLNADYRLPCIDYLTLFKLCQFLTHNIQEMWKLYKIMVFNYLIKNMDDHAKNFSFMFYQNEWKLTPAYDLLPSNGINGFHTTTINNKVDATRDDVIEVAVKAGLDRSQAEDVFNRLESICLH